MGTEIFLIHPLSLVVEHVVVVVVFFHSYFLFIYSVLDRLQYIDFDEFLSLAINLPPLLPRPQKRFS